MLNSKDDTYIENLEILSAKDFVAGWASGKHHIYSEFYSSENSVFKFLKFDIFI